MKCIDFDSHFQDYCAKWVQDHRKEYRNYDAMEADMPRIYMNFLNTPAKWLEGVTPGAYFTQWEDPKYLVDWMVEYCRRDISVPEQLLDQIKEVGRPCEKRLVTLLKEKDVNLDACMTAIGLLREMESDLPKTLYIDWQLNRREDDEVCDNALDSLKEMGKQVVQPILERLPAANDAGQMALLDVLVDYPGHEMIFNHAMKMFRKHPQDLSLMCSYLAKLGDDRALPELIAAAEKDDISYVDYIELRNAIEALGGTAPEHDFSDDPDYGVFSGLPN